MSTSERHTPHKDVVIGGGYAGTLAANHLRMRADVDITLVNPRPEFVERIRLHQFVAETGEATVDCDTLLGEGIQLIVDSSTRIDTAAQAAQPLGAQAADTVLKGGDLQTRGVEDPPRGPQTGFQLLAQGRPASRAAGLCSARGHVPVTTSEHAERVHGVDEQANESRIQRPSAPAGHSIAESTATCDFEPKSRTTQGEFHEHARSI
ncbi:hypothetical protein AB0392_33675 [Nonomuraea angiospora]|uniref:hypothetical protein n=1 Tax=Nonomuraea angiospora TaxID=46172 RepID=UPI003450C9BC